MKIPKIFFCSMMLLLFLTDKSYGQGETTFTNPLVASGADPWCIYKDGYYYYTNSTGNNITLRKTSNIATLKTAKKKYFSLLPAVH